MNAESVRRRRGERVLTWQARAPVTWPAQRAISSASWAEGNWRTCCCSSLKARSARMAPAASLSFAFNCGARGEDAKVCELAGPGDSPVPRTSVMDVEKRARGWSAGAATGSDCDSDELHVRGDMLQPRGERGVVTQNTM